MLPRDDALAALADESFDVLVIGGGITGAGAYALCVRRERISSARSIGGRG